MTTNNNEYYERFKGNKLAAVKAYKDDHNCDLREAKQAIDEIFREHEPEKYSKSGAGCSVVLLIGISLTLGTIMLF